MDNSRFFLTASGACGIEVRVVYVDKEKSVLEKVNFPMFSIMEQWKLLHVFFL